MAFWRTVGMTRLRFSPSISQFRLLNKLSASATVSALREFYLSVHPDFFAQHPQIQKINESSLKRLNSYLEAIQNTRQIKNLKPVKVAFYFRKENPETRASDFKLVNFTLRSHDLLTNIEHILDSCGLPVTELEHVVQKETKRAKERPVEERYRKTTTFEDVYPSSSDERGEDRVSEISLRKWLRRNIQDIRKEQESSRSIRETNEDLKNDICLNFGLREITWCSPWQHRSEQGILRNFRRFCFQNRGQVQCLQGKRLVFTDRTMAAADESVCLNVEDVPQQWLQFLSEYTAKYFDLFKRAKTLDDIICQKCGNIKVVRPEVVMSRFREHSLASVFEYLQLLEDFTVKLQSLPHSDELKVLPWSLRNHELTFASLQNPDDERITVFSNGRLRVDGHCDPRYLLSFLLQNKVAMDEKKYVNASAKSRTKQLVELCKEKFKVTTLSKDFDVTHEQMSECCERLLQNATSLNILLAGLEIRITLNYYSVFDHGHFCIPWDWKA